eukprot:COSAG01_NODE_3391_length_6151_cov_4.717944_12_plen_27_part_01
MAYAPRELRRRALEWGVEAGALRRAEV